MQARALPVKEKAALARPLIEELDMTVEADAEQLWIGEVQRDMTPTKKVNLRRDLAMK